MLQTLKNLGQRELNHYGEEKTVSMTTVTLEYRYYTHYNVAGSPKA